MKVISIYLITILVILFTLSFEPSYSNQLTQRQYKDENKYREVNLDTNVDRYKPSKYDYPMYRAINNVRGGEPLLVQMLPSDYMFDYLKTMDMFIGLENQQESFNERMGWIRANTRLGQACELFAMVDVTNNDVIKIVSKWIEINNECIDGTWNNISIATYPMIEGGTTTIGYSVLLSN